MSHTSVLKLKMTNRPAIEAAAARIPGAKVLGEKRVTFYSSAAQGLAVQLPGWNYPIVINPVTGDISMDNFEGRWGEQTTLDRYLQAYGVEVARQEAQRSGYGFEETTLENGEIRCRLTVGGGSGYSVDSGGFGGYDVAPSGGL